MATHNPTQNTNHRNVRFNRHNLPPNTGAALVVIDADLTLLAVVSAAARFTTDQRDESRFDQLFMAQHGSDPQIPCECVSVPVTQGVHRTTIQFTENGFTKKIGKLAEGRCWAQISVRKRASEQLRPEIVWQPLDERTWRPTPEAMSKFPLPGIGQSFPMAANAREYAKSAPGAWHLFKTAAMVLGGMDGDAFPVVEPVTPTEMNFLQQREKQLKEARQAARTKSMLERLPAEMQKALMERLAGKSR